MNLLESVWKDHRLNLRDIRIDQEWWRDESEKKKMCVL